jgi:hypothetical protein
MIHEKYYCIPQEQHFELSSFLKNESLLSLGSAKMIVKLSPEFRFVQRGGRIHSWKINTLSPGWSSHKSCLIRAKKTGVGYIHIQIQSPTFSQNYTILVEVTQGGEKWLSVPTPS